MEDDLAGAKSLRVMMTYRQDHYSREQANLIADGVQHVFTQFAQHYRWRYRSGGAAARAAGMTLFHSNRKHDFQGDKGCLEP